MSSPNPSSERRVVITGVGLISPLGSSTTELWDALSTGRSGVVRREATDPPPNIAGLAPQFTGAIGDFGPLEKPAKKAIRKGLKLMCRETQMAVASAQLALGDSSAAEGDFDPERVGVILGSDYMLTLPDDYADAVAKCAPDGKFDYTRWGSDGLRDMQPLWMLRYLPNMPSSHIAIYNDLRGPSNSLTMRESSGLMAIGEALRIIARGSADRMVAGATGTRVMPLQAVHALQTETLAEAADPTTASRPFDADRTGMVCGEGAGMVVLESLESAQARGAKIYGEVLGFGTSTVTESPHSMEPLKGCNDVAIAGAVRAVLNDADLAPADVGHINAHGLGTVEADRDEATALRAAFGDSAESTPVIALKSYFGNLGAGSGLIELVGSLMAIEHGTLPRTLNHTTADPDCGLRVVTEAGEPAGDNFVSVSTTPQGQAAAVCVSRGV